MSSLSFKSIVHLLLYVFITLLAWVHLVLSSLSYILSCCVGVQLQFLEEAVEVNFLVFAYLKTLGMWFQNLLMWQSVPGILHVP